MARQSSMYQSPLCAYLGALRFCGLNWLKSQQLGPSFWLLLFYLVLFPGSAARAQPASIEPQSDPWNLFTIDQDVRLGVEMTSWLAARSQFSREPETSAFVARLGQQLAHSMSASKFQFSFTLIADKSIHAFAHPGGPVLCTTGLMALMEDEAELAGLLAHQMAHISLRHTTQAVSRADRFRARAALVAADTGKVNLLDALVNMGIFLAPGAPLMTFSPVAEADANRFTAQLLAAAGYEPHAAARAFDRLRTQGLDLALVFLQQHPAAGTGATLADPPQQPVAAKPLVSKRAYRRLRSLAGQTGAGRQELDAVLNWSEPVFETPPARSREQFLAGSYALDYPADWMPGKPGDKESIEVSPRGGRLQPAGQAAQLVVGLLAGTLEPIAGADGSSATLLQYLEAARPGLALTPGPPAGITHSAEFEQQFLTGVSPGGGDEWVWTLSRRLQDTVFYLLLIAPSSQFPDYQAEFQAIAASVQFSGRPRTGRVDARRQEGALLPEKTTHGEKP